MQAVTALPAGDQLLLQLISIIYEPVSTAFLTRCLAALDHELFGNRRPSEDEVAAMTARLRRKGFLNNKNQCPTALSEQLTRHTLKLGLFPRLVALVERAAPVDYKHGKWSTRCWRAMRQFRIGVYSQDFDKFDEALLFIEDNCQAGVKTDHPAVLVTAAAFDQEWFGSLPVSMQFFLLD